MLARLLIPLNISVPTGITHHFRYTAERKISEITNELKFIKNTENTTSSVITSNNPNKKSQIKIFHTFLELSEIIALSWFVIVILLGFGTFLWSWHVHNLVKKCNVVKRPDLNEFLQKKCWELGIKQEVEMYVLNINMPFGPTITGILKPKILLPFKIAGEWSIKEMEPILLHELVHIKRHDLIVNWIQIFIQIVYFFHPLVWYTNWKIREIREEISDDITIQFTENKRKRYSRSILNVLDGILYEPAWGLVDIGFSERKSSLAKRIIRIANKNYQFHKPLNFVSIFILIVFSVLSILIACENIPEKITGDVPVTEKAPSKLSSEVIEDRIHIRIKEDGKYEVDGIPTTLSNLEEVLKQVMERSNKKEVIIFPNHDTSPIILMNVMNVVEKSGIVKMGVIRNEKE